MPPLTKAQEAALFGIDVSCTDKMRPGRLVSGIELVAEAAYRRLTTTRGDLLEDPDYGINTQRFISLEMTPENAARIPSELQAELLKDDRIETVETTYALTGTGASLALSVVLDCTCGAGPFALTVTLTRETIDVVLGEKQAA